MNKLLIPLAPALGLWSGTGQGEFPHIQPFTYIDEIELRLDGGGERIYYEQRSYRGDVEKQVDNRMHSESGIIRVNGQSLEAVLVHGSGRIEVLELEVLELGSSEGRLNIELRSLRIENDPRMPEGSKSLRIWQLLGAAFNYSFAMSTKRVPKLTAHLSAQLTKCREEIK